MFAILQCHAKTSQLPPTQLNLGYDPYGGEVRPLLCPTPNRQGQWGIKQCFCLTLTSVCRIHRAYVKNRGSGRPKLAQRVAHVTRDSNTTFKVKRSRSPGRFTQRGLNG